MGTPPPGWGWVADTEGGRGGGRAQSVGNTQEGRTAGGGGVGVGPSEMRVELHPGP